MSLVSLSTTSKAVIHPVQKNQNAVASAECCPIDICIMKTNNKRSWWIKCDAVDNGTTYIKLTKKLIWMHINAIFFEVKLIKKVHTIFKWGGSRWQFSVLAVNMSWQDKDCNYDTPLMCQRLHA